MFYNQRLDLIRYDLREVNLSQPVFSSWKNDLIKIKNSPHKAPATAFDTIPVLRTWRCVTG